MRRRRRCDDPKPGNLLKNVALPPSKAWPTKSAPGPVSAGLFLLRLLSR